MRIVTHFEDVVMVAGPDATITLSLKPLDTRIADVTTVDALLAVDPSIIRSGGDQTSFWTSVTIPTDLARWQIEFDTSPQQFVDLASLLVPDADDTPSQGHVARRFHAVGVHHAFPGGLLLLKDVLIFVVQLCEYHGTSPPVIGISALDSQTKPASFMQSFFMPFNK